jgi:hypothetical protein
MAQFNFKHGQWVRFDGKSDLPELFKNPDGKGVGIYQAARTDALGHQAQECVVPVNVDGQNIRRLSEDGNMVLTATLDPATLPGLEPLYDISHIPEKRRLTLAEGFDPKNDAIRAGWKPAA